MNQCTFVLFYCCSQPRVGLDDKYLPCYLHAAVDPTVSARMPVVAVYAFCGSARTGKLDLIHFVSMNYDFIILHCFLAFAHTPHDSLSKRSTSPSARTCKHRGKVMVVVRPPISEPVQFGHD